MDSAKTTLTLIGGPTVLIEFDGLRLLTDPTFDPPVDYQGVDYHGVPYQGAGYQGAAYQSGPAGSGVPGGYIPQGNFAGQYDQRGYGSPDAGYGQDGYQAHPGYGPGGR